MTDFPQGLEHLVQEVERERQEAMRPRQVDPEIGRAQELGYFVSQQLRTAKIVPTDLLQGVPGWVLQDSYSIERNGDDLCGHRHAGSFLSYVGSISTYDYLVAYQVDSTNPPMTSYRMEGHASSVSDLKDTGATGDYAAHLTKGYIQLQKDLLRLLLTHGIKLPGQK